MKGAPQPPNMLTVSEVLGRTGLKSPRALARYAAQGLIDRPVTAPHPSRRGMTGYYPASTVERILEIRALNKRGANRITALAVTGDRRLDLLVEIAFGSDDPIYPSWDMSVIMKTRQNPTKNEKFIAAVAWRVLRVTGSKDVARRIASVVGAGGINGAALRCLREGFAPVLLVRGADMRVVADVALAADAMAEGTLAIPLTKIVEEVDFDAPVPAQVRVRSAGKVLVDEDGTTVERALAVGGPAGVRVVVGDDQRAKGMK